MAELTIKLIRDEQLRDSMGKNAQEDAQKRFKLEDMVNQYIDWYYEILDKTTSQAGSHV
jgi:glycosyltransferase involved in cell wall biosynthesis